MQLLSIADLISVGRIPQLAPSCKHVTRRREESFQTRVGSACHCCRLFTEPSQRVAARHGRLTDTTQNFM